MLQALDKTLTAIERKPEIVQLISRLVPQTVVTSGTGDSGLAGAAAIFGNAFKNREEPRTPAPPQPAR